MAFSIISSVTAQTSNNNDVTTGGIDTTGADLIILGVVNAVAAAANVISDSKSNTWITVPPGDHATSAVRLQTYYAKSPTVGTGHTFAASTVTNSLPCLFVIAVSGAHLTAPLDQDAGNVEQASANTLLAGSNDPTNADELMVAIIGLNNGHSGMGIDSGYTVELSNPSIVGFGGALAWKINTTGAAENPAFTWTVNSTHLVASHTSWFTAAGGGGSTGNPWYAIAQQ